jgi:membrane protein implicated in regulation of membrane protease activity
MDLLVSVVERLGLWSWWAIAGVILIAELLTGTTYLLWPAAAAFLTGFIALDFLNVGWPMQLGFFAILSVVLIWAGDRWARPAFQMGADSGLNDRSLRMVGQRVVSVATFHAGRGRVRFGDTEWAAETKDGSNPDAEDLLFVSEVKGVILVVDTHTN